MAKEKTKITDRRKLERNALLRSALGRLRTKGLVSAYKRDSGPETLALNYQRLAKAILGKPHGHLIKAYESDYRAISEEALERLFALFPDVLRDMQPLSSRLPMGLKPIGAKVVYYNQPAYASQALELSLDPSEMQYFHLPNMTGEFVAFPVEGNSMVPYLQSGDLVICKPLSNQDRIEDNEVYAIVAQSGLMVKRVQKIQNGKGRLLKYKLISDNYLEHDPFELELEEVRAMFRVVKRVTGI